MNISLRLSHFLLYLPAMTTANKRTRMASKSGKVKLPQTTFGYVSTDLTTSCAVAAASIYSSGDFAACSRYWYNGGAGQNSTCAGTAGYLADPSGNDPSNGNPDDNTCLGAGDTPSCFVLEGVNDNEPVLVRTSVAWDWSEYAIPFLSPNSGSCGQVDELATAPSSVNTCAEILTNSSIPLVGASVTNPSTPGSGGQLDQTTGQCYDVTNPPNIFTNPGVSNITSTVTFTIDSNDYVCDVTAGGQVCEMWGYTNGYGNNFDSQYIPFLCDDIGGDAYEGYITFVFDHFLLTPVLDGIGQAPQIVLKRL